MIRKFSIRFLASKPQAVIFPLTETGMTQKCKNWKRNFKWYRI